MDVYDETQQYNQPYSIDDFEKPIEKPKKMKKEEKSKMDELLADMEATFSS